MQLTLINMILSNCLFALYNCCIFVVLILCDFFIATYEELSKIRKVREGEIQADQQMNLINLLENVENIEIYTDSCLTLAGQGKVMLWTKMSKC